MARSGCGSSAERSLEQRDACQQGRCRSALEVRETVEGVGVVGRIGLPEDRRHSLENRSLTRVLAQAIVNGFEIRPRAGSGVGGLLESVRESRRPAVRDVPSFRRSARRARRRRPSARARCSRARRHREPRRAGPSSDRNEQLVAAFLAQHTLERHCLALALGGRVQGRLEQLLGSILVVFQASNRRKLEEHFPSTDLSLTVRVRSTEDEEQSSERPAAPDRAGLARRRACRASRESTRWPARFLAARSSSASARAESPISRDTLDSSKCRRRALFRPPASVAIQLGKRAPRSRPRIERVATSARVKASPIECSSGSSLRACSRSGIADAGFASLRQVQVGGFAQEARASTAGRRPRRHRPEGATPGCSSPRPVGKGLATGRASGSRLQGDLRHPLEPLTRRARLRRAPDRRRPGQACP